MRTINNLCWYRRLFKSAYTGTSRANVYKKRKILKDAASITNTPSVLGWLRAPPKKKAQESILCGFKLSKLQAAVEELTAMTNISHSSKDEKRLLDKFDLQIAAAILFYFNLITDGRKELAASKLAQKAHFSASQVRP
jgi:hypothetical protein